MNFLQVLVTFYAAVHIIHDLIIQANPSIAKLMFGSERNNNKRAMITPPADM